MSYPHRSPKAKGVDSENTQLTTNIHMLTAKMSPFVHTFTLWITCGQLWISTVSLVPANRNLVCDIYGFTTIIITNQHKTYRHPPNTSHTYTSYSPPANCLLTCQPATQAANQAANQDNQASKPRQPTRVLSTAQQHASHSQPQPATAAAQHH